MDASSSLRLVLLAVRNTLRQSETDTETWGASKTRMSCKRVTVVLFDCLPGTGKPFVVSFPANYTRSTSLGQLICGSFGLPEPRDRQHEEVHIGASEQDEEQVWPE